MDKQIVPSMAELERFVAPPPRYIGLNLAQHCNLNCPMCHFYGQTPQSGPAAKEKMRVDVIDLLAPTIQSAQELWLMGPGEPLIQNNLFDYVSKCHEHNPDIRVNTVSNGVLLSEQNARLAIEKRLYAIEFSMDGTIQYGHFGGGANYDRIKDNLWQLARLKNEYGVKEPRINIIFVAMRDNLCELPGLIEFAGKIKATVRLQSLVPASEEQRNQNVLRHVDYTLEMLSKCKAQAEKLGVEFEYEGLANDLAQIPPKCDMPNYSLWVECDGRLVPCCNPMPTEWNIYQENLSVEEIWNGPTMLRLRWELETGNYGDACASCGLLKNTIQDRERSIPPHPLEHKVARLKEENQRLKAHIEAIERGRVMRMMRAVNRLMGK